MKYYKATILRTKIVNEEADIIIQVADDNDIDIEEVIKNTFTAQDSEDWQECNYEIDSNIEVKNIKQQGE